MAKKVKKKFLTGLILILVSFLGIFIILYLLGSENNRSFDQIEQLKDQVSSLETNKLNVENELTVVKSKSNTIELDVLLTQAEKKYGPDEKNRREGLLWLDPQTSVYVVTLGAINGIQPGSLLMVYDGEKKVGQVKVDTPLDVISYVSPVDQSLQRLDNNYFRVVIE
ncbi:MAG: hypothetical protein WC552_04105 [Candidatus Omnitrophota bacterium]